jgi:hypothetical protein
MNDDPMTFSPDKLSFFMRERGREKGKKNSMMDTHNFQST